MDFDSRQTCCGQPAFNSGFVKEACSVASTVLDIYAEGDSPLVVPSGSCAAMLRRLPELFPEGPDHARARAVADRTHELASFLVRELDQPELQAQWHGRLTWHDACHGYRELGLKEEPRLLLSKVQGAELVEARGCDTCCGFGGTFSVKHPSLSVAMVDWKIAHLEQAEVDAVVSSDVSCLMQIGGRLEARGSSLKTLHLAEVLAAQ